MTEAKCLACDGSRIAPWSTARDIEYLSTNDAFDYVRCTDCGALSIASVPRDRLGEIYPETYYSFSGGKLSPVERVKQWLDRRLFRKLLSEIPGDRLAALDVGGGTGWLLTQARAVEPRLTRTAVVDLDAKAEAEAVAQGHEFHLGRIEDFDSNSRFDLILLLNLIEHVEDPVAVLAKMRELLAPGGRILVKTPNHDSLDARLFRHRSWGGYHCPRHWVIFTPESFARAAGAAGLDVERTQLDSGRALLGRINSGDAQQARPGQGRSRPADVSPPSVRAAARPVRCVRLIARAVRPNVADVHPSQGRLTRAESREFPWESAIPCLYHRHGILPQ